MTHEQKPESAEFRTREAQKAALAEALEDGMSRSASAEEAERYIAEVEARGAAEQRREDAEGAGADAWVPVHPKHGNLWTMTTNDPNRERLPHEYPLAPLYLRPTNVTALEARVKELEGEIAQVKKASFNHGYLIACCNISHLHDEPSIARDVLAECGLGAGDISAIELSDYDAEALSQIRASRGDRDPICGGDLS